MPYLATLPHQTRNQVPGDGYSIAPCEANCCAAEMIRGMIDGYTPLGEVRTTSKDTSDSAIESVGGEGEQDAKMAGGLPRLCQVCEIHGNDYYCVPMNNPFKQILPLLLYELQWRPKSCKCDSPISADRASSCCPCRTRCCPVLV